MRRQKWKNRWGNAAERGVVVFAVNQKVQEVGVCFGMKVVEMDQRLMGLSSSGDEKEVFADSGAMTTAELPL